MTEDQSRSLQDKFMLRLPDGMRGRLKEHAMINNRSLNAEIVARLSASLDRKNSFMGMSNEQFEEFVRQFLERYGQISDPKRTDNREN